MAQGAKWGRESCGQGGGCVWSAHGTYMGLSSTGTGVTLGEFCVKAPRARTGSQSNCTSRETVPGCRDPGTELSPNALCSHAGSGWASPSMPLWAPPGLHGCDRRATSLHGLSEPSCPGGSRGCQSHRLSSVPSILVCRPPGLVTYRSGLSWNSTHLQGGESGWGSAAYTDQLAAAGVETPGASEGVTQGRPAFSQGLPGPRPPPVFSPKQDASLWQTPWLTGGWSGT